jgi:uncharacterized small protein (DUF1192 family)
MDTDEIAPPPRVDDLVAALARQDLDPLSAIELDARIAALAAEIARTRRCADVASAQRNAADELFKR